MVSTWRLDTAVARATSSSGVWVLCVSVLHINSDIDDPFSLLNLWELSQLRQRRSGQCAVPLGTPRSSCTAEPQALVLVTRDNNDFVDVLDSCENLSMVFSTSDLQVLVIATQLHIHLLIRELQLVYLDIILDLLDVRHCLYAAA